jgi:hypothetical protein
MAAKRKHDSVKNRGTTGFDATMDMNVREIHIGSGQVNRKQGRLVPVCLYAQGGQVGHVQQVTLTHALHLVTSGVGVGVCFKVVPLRVTTRFFLGCPVC